MQYQSVEDRILLLMKTTDLSEFRFWITRHYVMRIWPRLLEALRADLMVRLQTEPPAKADMVSFQHESAVANSDFDSRYEKQTRATPLGETPILLARFQIKVTDTSQKLVCLHPPLGQGVEIALDNTMLHSFCNLLSSTVSKTQWGLRLNISELTDTTSRAVN